MTSRQSAGTALASPAASLQVEDLARPHDPRPPPPDKPLIIDAVTHRYGSASAVDNVTLDIKAGELIALLGPSGCGKTTLLRIIAGFIVQSEGHVIIGENDDRRAAAEPARSRHRVPELRAVSAHDHRRQHRLWARGARHAGGRAEGARRRDAGADQARPHRATAIRSNSPAGSSSAWRSPARSR